MEGMQEQVVRTLQDLIRFNTTNPPGNETPLCEYVRDRLGEAGIEARVIEAAPGRGSVIARLRGDGSLPPLLLLSHIDVVTAEAERWAHPPFDGVIADGHVWGRGAVDTKGLTAMELETILRLKREGVPLKRDVILAATADEEAGARYGIKYLMDHHWDLIAAEYCLNEGGGIGARFGDRWLFTAQTAEKGICWTRMRAQGRPGHASVPWGDTAVGALAAAVDRLARARLPLHPSATVERYVRALAEAMPDGQDVLGLLDPARADATLAAMADQSLAAVLSASLRNTAVPTILRAGQKINVIPSEAEAQIDCRIAPGVTREQAVSEIRQVAGDAVELDVMEFSAAVESEYRTPLFDLIASTLAEAQPGAMLAPAISTGATDGRYLVSRGVKVYGFIPLKHEADQPRPSTLFHAHDERVSLANLEFASGVLWNVVCRWAA